MENYLLGTELLKSHEDIEGFFSKTPIGSIDKSIANNIYGINHRQTGGYIPSNQDQYGLTFFVRPQLNLQNDNLRNQRIFYPLLNSKSTSIQRAIRCLLDPRLMYGYRMGNGKIMEPISCPLVDNELAFIPALTNNLERMSGWPDIVAPTSSSAPDLLEGVQTIVDGPTVYNQAFDLDCTFRNTKGDIILYLTYVWMRYMSAVYTRLAVPYLDMIVEREIDYNTRIYRLVLDKQRRIVTKIAATNASFPVSSPLGSFFDFDKTKPFNDQNKEFTVRFKCDGVTYMDDILIHEFNRSVEIFNPAMGPSQRNTVMAKMSSNMLSTNNWRGYPRINPETYELEWWAFTSAHVASGNVLSQNIGSLSDMLSYDGD